MTPVEAVRVQISEYKDWEEKMKKVFGADLFEGFNYAKRDDPFSEETGKVQGQR